MFQVLDRSALVPPPLEPRLQKRHPQLVQEHLQISQRVAAGLNALPGVATSFASTQAAWRFYQNPRVSLSALAQPLIEHGRAADEIGLPVDRLGAAGRRLGVVGNAGVARAL
jgi:hypothetical protein